MDPSKLDLSALSAPAVKLIETVSAAVGRIYEPTHIRRLASAEADAAITRAETDIKVQELASRASERLYRREVRRQKNIESIIESSMKYLPSTVSEEKVDEDWVN